MLAELFSISLGAVLIENFIFNRFLGICPFLGVSKKVETAAGMGMAVTFTMTLAAAITWLIQTFVLSRFDLEYMQTVVFILVIAALVQFIEMALQKMMPALYSSLGIYLPLITTNCAVLGAALLNVQNANGFIESVVFGFMAAVGFTIAIILFASVRERLEYSDVPPSFQGFPIALVSAALIAIAFMGFSGLKVL